MRPHAAKSLAKLSWRERASDKNARRAKKNETDDANFHQRSGGQFFADAIVVAVALVVVLSVASRAPGARRGRNDARQRGVVVVVNGDEQLQRVGDSARAQTID